MNRRKFMGAVAATSIAVQWDNPLFAAEESAPKAGELWDMVAVRNGGPVEMFEAGIKAMGGIKRFVKSGMKVVIKPNIAWDKAPEIPANTNPELVGAVVRQCLEAGAAKVVVFDHTCHHWEKSYKTSGIGDAVKSAGGELVSGNLEDFYRDVTIDKAKALKTVKVHREYLDCDACINIPVLKHHGGAKVSLAMKNLMGVVWDRRFYHQSGLDQCIADFCLGPKLPVLNIIDAYRILRKNGPQGTSPDDGELAKYQILGTDIVAVDSAATKLFGMDADTIGYIKIANALNIGKSDLAGVKVQRISL